MPATVGPNGDKRKRYARYKRRQLSPPATIGDAVPVAMKPNGYYGRTMSAPQGSQGTSALVRARLAAIRMSIQELSDITGIGYSAMQRRVRGEIEFTVAELCDIAEAMDIAPWELLPPRDPDA